MKKALINKDGYFSCPWVKDATIEIEISDDDKEKISAVKINHRWKYANGEIIDEPIMEKANLQDMRQRECFRIIDNRSQLWFRSLTEKQNQELNDWYQAWLDVTETKIIPKKPEWLK